MSNYKLVFSDLDGTLLRRDMTVSDENKAAIKKMTELGVGFVASSGRAHTGLPEDVVNCDDIRYLISSNGAVIYDKAVKKNIVTSFMPREVAEVMFEVVKKYDASVFAHFNGIMYVDEALTKKKNYEYYNINDYYSGFIERTGITLDSVIDTASKIDNLEMITVFFHSQEELDECTERILAIGDYKVVSSCAFNIEIFYKKSGKGASLRALAEHLGISIEDTIAVGDSTNDKPMIDAAGLSLAMENAFPEVKKSADAVICHYNDHAADYILKHYIL